MPHRPDQVRKLVEKLAVSGERLHSCYEADPCGYGLHRQLAELGHGRIVVAQHLAVHGKRPGQSLPLNICACPGSHALRGVRNRSRWMRPCSAAVALRFCQRIGGAGRRDDGDQVGKLLRLERQQLIAGLRDLQRAGRALALAVKQGLLGAVAVDV